MSSIDQLLAAVRRRERLADLATGLTRWALPAGLFIAAACLIAVRRFGAPGEILWLTGLPLPVLAAWTLWRPRSLRASARRVDAHYSLDDEIGNAFELASSAPRGVSGEDPRTAAIVELIQDSAQQRAKSLDPRPVVPLRIPGPRWVDGVALLAVLGALFIPRPQTQQMQRWFAAPQLDALLTLPTRAGMDLALADPLRQNLRSLTDTKDEASKIAQQILETLDKLESGELDRAEAFAELERLEELLRQAEEEFEAKLDEDPGMLADAMRELAESLEEHEITEKAGEALDDGRAEDAQEALDEAAEKAAEGTQAEQDAARKAMEAAERKLKDAAKKAANSDTDKQLDEAERRLRKEQKKKDPKDPEEHERRLKKMKERVEQLRRQQQREQAAQRRLDQLRRNAADAANSKKSGQQRKRSMQKLSRGASGASKKSRQASRMRQIRDAMDEAKTFVRRAGKQGDSAKRRRQQFRRFSKAAKGNKGKKGKKGKGKTTLMVEGDVGNGQPDMFMEGDGQGQDGQGQDGDGQGQDGQGDGQGQGQDGGQGQMPGGDGIGDGSVDPLGDEAGIKTSKKTVHVKAKEGRGVSRAEVISESSQDGFATESYRDVFTDYRRFAQSALDNEALPPAQRRAVKRYYQLISPRE